MSLSVWVIRRWRWRRARSLDPEIVTWAQISSWTFNRLSHAGTPGWFSLKISSYVSRYYEILTYIKVSLWECKTLFCGFMCYFRNASWQLLPRSPKTGRPLPSVESPATPLSSCWWATAPVCPGWPVSGVPLTVPCISQSPQKAQELLPQRMQERMRLVCRARTGARAPWRPWCEQTSRSLLAVWMQIMKCKTEQMQKWAKLCHDNKSSEKMTVTFIYLMWSTVQKNLKVTSNWV